jgi:DMSO/TMAO reductase YedYZ molybdopterin-dependent catalytic subunit
MIDAFPNPTTSAPRSINMALHVSSRQTGSATSRRLFLQTVCRAGTVLATGRLLSDGELMAQRVSRKEALIVRSTRPEDLETPAHLLTSWITPNDLFFVRSHFYTPSIQAGAWRLRVDGDVGTALELTLDDLRRLPLRTAVITLECAGNGRAFFNPPVAGVQWRKGAVGTARWTGVHLADLLRRAGVRPSARHVWLDGADVGIGKAPDFIRNLPMDKAMDADTLLAFEMNGEPLPLSHGFPLRAIVPGWEGAYSIKWLTRIHVSDREHDGPFVQSGYRYPRYPVSPGAVVAPADMVPLQGLPVKSLLSTPAADSAVPGGPVRISGFAWAGDEEVARVDVSSDGGRTWTAARLGSDRARHAWRQFEHVWQPAGRGAFVVMSRATDTRGRAQPIVPDWNPAGYLWNAVDQLQVIVGG